MKPAIAIFRVSAWRHRLAVAAVSEEQAEQFVAGLFARMALHGPELYVERCKQGEKFVFAPGCNMWATAGQLAARVIEIPSVVWRNESAAELLMKLREPA